MQGNIHQIPVLLAVLALIYIANHSSAKYNLVGRDDKITTMKVNVEKGISYIFTPIKKQINEIEFGFVFLNMHYVYSVFQMRYQSQ